MATTVLAGAQVSPSGEPGPVGAIQPAVWSARQRSFNSIGNPNFEIDQNLVGTVQANTANGYGTGDRWVMATVGTMRFSTQTMPATADPIAIIPGTNFRITNNFLRLTLTTAQPSLAAGDYFGLGQTIEGIRFRELASDVHSLSLLVRSSVPSVKFAVVLNDTGSTRSLCKLCTTSATANTSTVIQLPALPVWPSSGSFGMVPYSVGYVLNIMLCCGSNYIVPAEGVWQNGNFIGAPGMGNFAANAVNSTFDIAFVQHEPGPDCSSLIDIPFSQNLDDCMRYYQKSFPYTVVPGTPSNANFVCMGPVPAGWQSMSVGFQFRKELAKPGNVIYYNPVAGSPNGARGWPSGYNYTISGIAADRMGTYSHTVAPATPQVDVIQVHYIAYTGW
jgi:hypothetical protein